MTRSTRAASAIGAAVLALVLVVPEQAGAQLLPTTTEPPATTEPVPETTVPPETTAPPTTAPPTTAPPTTAPPATRAPTTAAPTTEPPTTTTTAPPSAPSTAPTTTVPVEGRARITQDTPALGGVLTLWGLGIVGTLATLAWSWQRNRTSGGGA
ncbi:MAG TPA: hypothetical protein VLR27_06385 [Acidimicrobiales bacterium]|nr:hypothetical protein [Acidimicrobiales bacterium]